MQKDIPFIVLIIFIIVIIILTIWRISYKCSDKKSETYTINKEKIVGSSPLPSPNNFPGQTCQDYGSGPTSATICTNAGQSCYRFGDCAITTIYNGIRDLPRLLPCIDKDTGTTCIGEDCVDSNGGPNGICTYCSIDPSNCVTMGSLYPTISDPSDCAWDPNDIINGCSDFPNGWTCQSPTWQGGWRVPGNVCYNSSLSTWCQAQCATGETCTNIGPTGSFTCECTSGSCPNGQICDPSTKRCQGQSPQSCIENCINILEAPTCETEINTCQCNPCKGSNDCEPNEICVDTDSDQTRCCVPKFQCTLDSDCADKGILMKCTGHQGSSGYCSTLESNINRPCLPGSVLDTSNDFCRPICNSNNDCPPNFGCSQPGVGFCTPA